MANDKSDENQWFLRIAGGKVYGPVSAKGLLAWAEKGCIGPGNEVSHDREHWLPAEQLAELEMHWYVNVGSRTEGPFNRVAAENLLKNNKALSGARLIHAHDVDPALLARRTPSPAPVEPEPAVTLAPPPTFERKASDTQRQNAPEPATQPAPRDRRIAELARVNEKQRADLEPTRPNVKTQTALEEERDELRRQLQEQQAQLENVRANAEKDAQKRDRKLETLKQEMLRLQQEQDEAKARSLLELDVAAATRNHQQALDDVRRQAEDERRTLERDAEQLRARIQQLEGEQATTYDEVEKLRLESARQNRQGATLAEQATQFARERDQLAEERNTLQQQLSSAMSAAADAANETSNSELRRRIEQLEAVVAGLRTQLAQSDEALAAERANLADLLAGSNERDVVNRQRIDELESALAAQAPRSASPPTPEPEPKLLAELTTARTRIAELQARLARPPEVAPAPAPDADGWLRQFATDELSTLDKALHAERQSFHDFREVSTTRQEAIQARIQAVQQLLSGRTADARRASTGKLRGTPLESTRLQFEVDAMRDTQQREAKHFEEREQELLRRIRGLETEEARLRALLEATDMKGDQRLALTETIRRREQELAQERRHRDQDREQFQSAQQALLRRIEVLERGALGASTDIASDGAAAPAPPAKPRRLTNFGRWLQS